MDDLRTCNFLIAPHDVFFLLRLVVCGGHRVWIFLSD